MTREQETLFYLVRLGLGGQFEPFLQIDDIDWETLIELSYQQGVAAIAVDGLQRIYDNNLNLKFKIDLPEWEKLKYDWYSCVIQSESDFSKHFAILCKLARFYQNKGIRLLLLKGYGLSLNYPVPSHRPSGDIDVYLYGQGGIADQMIEKYFNIKVKQNEDKHSTFIFDGVTVENHGSFIEDARYPYYVNLEKFLKADSENAQIIEICNAEVCIPTITTNALFLPLHCGGHFFRGEANLRQICDWACFVKNNGQKINWEIVKLYSERAGYFKFLCCLNGIIHNYLDVPSNCLPSWKSDVSLEMRILNDLLTVKRPSHINLLKKVFLFFSNHWKYVLIHKECMLMSAIRQAKAYRIVHGIRKINIWD